MNEIVRNKVLKEIKPTKQEHKILEKVVSKLTKKIELSAKNLNINCELFIGGSFGKGTYLKGDYDVDIFVRFSPTYNDKELTKLLEKILNTAKIKYKKQKGSRDYYSGKFTHEKTTIQFETIPNKKVSKANDAVNSTDLSPLHVEFLKKKMEKNINLSDEIRLAKQFFKAKNLYGAESYINGFSGHVIDILIAHYKSLDQLINSAKTWSETKFIDIKKTYNNEADARNAIGLDKNSSLTLIDPIIKNRNAARAISQENYSKFLFTVSQISELVEDDFIIKKIKYKDKIKSNKAFAKKNNLKLVIYKINFTTNDDSEDIVGSKLKRLQRKIKEEFEFYDFKIFSDEFFIEINEEVCLFIYLFEKISLPNIKIIKGPKTHMHSAIKKFTENRKNIFIVEDRICVYEKRNIIKIEQIINVNINYLEKLLGRNLKFILKSKILK